MKALASGRLSELISQAGFELPPGAVVKLMRHAEEMLLWNRSIRLTAITDPEEVAVKHIIDSLLLLSFSPYPGRTLDFGSGAGYPGIPLAVALPDARVVLLESSAKKCAFLSRARSLLGLGNLEVVRGRLTAENPLAIGRFEQIVTRATLPPAEAAALLVPCLAPSGRLLLMTGPGGGEEELPRGAACSRRERFELPLGMGAREIREIRAAAG